jgi:CheY-like chemotaxis protein
MRIMIVDDNAAMRKVLSALFVSAGHEVLATLEDGSKLEQYVHDLSPDLLCLDYHLPGRNGLQLLRTINALAPDVDVVFMTASSEQNIEGLAADAGAAGFIRKPFGQAQIINELREIEETRKHARQPVRKGPALFGGRVSGSAVIADDNSSVRLVLKGLLEECGLKVVQAVASGSEAIVAARNHKPKLLCLDVNMPVMGGIEALPQIVAASPDTAVVMVTGCTDKKLVAEAAGLGARGYIIKPLRPAYVQDFVRKLFGV